MLRSTKAITRLIDAWKCREQAFGLRGLSARLDRGIALTKTDNQTPSPQDEGLYFAVQYQFD